MWRYLLALPFLVHGAAHVSGFLASWTVLEVGFSGSAWILSPNVSYRSVIGRGFGVLWLAAALGHLAAGLGLILGQDWWVSAALGGSLVSLMVIVPWWNTVPPGARLGAAFDLLVILVLLTPARDLLPGVRIGG